MRLFISKTTIATFLIGIAVTGLHAQDTMITQDGDVKTVYVVDIGSKAVVFLSVCLKSVDFEVTMQS